MSGLEVLGAVSGAVQLVDAGLGIIKFLTILCSKIHDAPDSIKRRTIQIQHLVEVAQLIQQNPSLQTTLIGSLLMNCIEKAKELQDVLAKVTAKLNAGKIEKYWKALGVVMKESKISELCKSLDEEKSALVLCIASIDSDMLRSIDTRLVVVREGVDELLGELPSIRDTAQGVTQLLTELVLLKGMTSNLRRELSSVLEKVTEVANRDTGREQFLLDSSQSTEIQSALPALRQALGRLNINDSMEIDSDIQDAEAPMKLTNDLYSNKKAIECLASLGATDQTSFLSERLGHDKYACRWFFETPRVKSWLSNPDVGSEILYVTARAGCGKTTIVAHTVQHIKNTLKDSQMGEKSKSITRPLLLYFFFQKRSLDEEGTAIAAMKAIISQLLHRMPNCYPVLLKQYQILSMKQPFSWTLEHLWSVLIGILESFSGRPFIFIVLDGLDECETNSRYSLLKRLRSLIKDLDSQDPANAPYILKVMISGRPDEQLSEYVPSAKHFEVTIADTASDMNALIESRISQFATRRSLDPQTAQNLSSFLNKRAQGMFLWVELVMEELDRRDARLSDDVIATKLQRVPQTLFSQYEAILKNSPSSRQADLWRILRWVLNARRGMSLEELEAALCTELEISKWHDLKGDINYLCGSVIRLDGGIVSFIHQTFRDFLYDYIAESTRDLTGGIGMGVYETETHLATTCLKFFVNTNHLYKLDVLLDQGRLPRNRDVELYMQTSPFLSYAAEFWASHLGTADSLMTQIQPMHREVINLFKSSLNRDLLMRLDYFLRHSKHPESCRCGSKLHLAAYFKLPLLVEYYLSVGESVMADAGPNSYPLVWACETGSYECVEKLLEAGADPNLLEYDGWSPLHWAATNGHESVCGLLIRYGAKKDVQDSRGYTPRDMAVQMGQYEIARKNFGWVEGAKIPNRNFPSAISGVGWRYPAGYLEGRGKGNISK